MEILSNIFYASFILSVLVLIIVAYLLNDYELESNSYIKLFIYTFALNVIFINYYNKSIIDKYNFKPITAAAEVFDEITDSQQLNGIMPIRDVLGGNDELIIDNIPKSITCNNIVYN